VEQVALVLEQLALHQYLIQLHPQAVVVVECMQLLV
jgi:hypothetical protein